MTLTLQSLHLQGILPADHMQGDFALPPQMQQNCLWWHHHQHCIVFKPGSSYNFAQHAVLSISLLSVCSAIKKLCSFKLIHAVLALNLSLLVAMCMARTNALMQEFFLNNPKHLAFEPQHLHRCVINVLQVTCAKNQAPLMRL